MSNQIDLGKGSKRSVRQIKWTRIEILSLLIFGIVLVLVILMTGLWINP